MSIKRTKDFADFLKLDRVIRNAGVKLNGANVLIGYAADQPYYYDWSRCAKPATTPQVRKAVQAEVKRLEKLAADLTAWLGG